jgi:hypothetical protein
MSKQDQALSGDHVEVREGEGQRHFYIEGTEVDEAMARANGWVPEADDAPEQPSAAEATSNGAGEDDAATDVEARLRAGYAAGQGERRKTIEIAPARYRDFAAEFKPIDWDLRRRLIRIAGRRGESGVETDRKINSQLMADACMSMMFRPAPGEDYVQLHTTIERFKGGEPVRFDSRLAEILGIELIGGESEGDICRLVFGDPGIFEAHYMALNGWSLDAFDADGEEEEDEGGDRPT